MGGISVGIPSRNKETKNLEFWGALSKENNGGFSTIKTDVDPDVFKNSIGAKIKVFQ